MKTKSLLLKIALVVCLVSNFGCARRQIIQPFPSATYPTASSAGQANQFEEFKEIEIKDDKFEKNISFKGFVDKSGSKSALLAPDMFLRSWLNKDTWLIRHQVYWTDSYYGSNWRFWFLASDENAKSLEIVDIHKDVLNCSGYGGCSHYETVGIMVPDAMLRAKRTTGLQIKVKARDGSERILSLSPVQIEAQLTAIASKLPKNVKPLGETGQHANQKPKKRARSH